MGLTAGTAAARCRVATGMRHIGSLPLKVNEAKAELWQRELDKRSAECGPNLTAALNSYGEFAEPEKRRAGYGMECSKKIFGAYNRIMVNEVCHVMERKFGRQGLFLTFTVPGKGEAVEKAIASWSGYIVKRVRQWFRDRLQAEHSVCGVWEFQRRGMLHLHIAVMSGNREGLDAIKMQFKQFWAALLVRLIELSGVNVCAASAVMSRLPGGEDSQQSCEWIRKSVGRYMSKYVSKAPREASKKVRYYPSRWVTIDRATHREAKTERVRVCMEGFSIDNWRIIVRELGAVLEVRANDMKRFINPFSPLLLGVMAWFEAGDDWMFLDEIWSRVSVHQNMGANLSYGS